MRQAMDDGIADILSSVVDDVGQAVERNINGAQLLYELLSAPWLRSLLKIYECLLQFQRLSPSPFLPYASGLSHEIMTMIQKTHRPSHEARELYGLLSSPHIQALLSTHDSVAQSDYEPVLPPLPDDLPDDEEAMRIVCLVKNNQPLRGEDHGGSVGDGLGLVRSRWSSLRRLTLERLVPARRAWSGEELRVDESDARLLPRGGQPHPFLPRYQSTGSCCSCSQAAEHQKRRLNQSAPSVFSPAASMERPKPSRKEGASIGGSSDDYAYPPPPVPAYSFSLPNSPILYKKCATGGQSRNIPTPGRTPSGHSSRPPRVHTAPSSPATQRSTRQQGVSTLPTPLRHHGLHDKCQEDPLKDHSRIYYSIDPHRNEPPQPPEFTKRCSMEELRSTVQTVASSMEHSSKDVHHLGQKMMEATGMITDSVEDNAQALNLLVEVVDKLQGLIVAKKHHEVSPPSRPKQLNKPTPPPRVSSLSPKVVRKPPTPYPHQRSPSSSSSRSSSSSSTSPSSGADGFAMSRSPKRLNGGSKRTMATFGRPQRAACSSGSNGQVRFNNGTVSRAHLEDHKDCNSTGCLATKKKTKKKK